MPHIISIDQTDSEALDVFTRMSETELRRLYEPERGLFIAESAHIVHRALDFNRACAEMDASDEKTASISEKNVSDKRIVPLSPFIKAGIKSVPDDPAVVLTIRITLSREAENTGILI